MSNSAAIQSVRGMRTILPPESEKLAQLSTLVHEILSGFAYQPWSLPLLEKTALFQRTIGEETDIVAKEMYTFADRKGESLSLRPEATAGVVRAMIQEGLLQQPQRLFVEGPMFRYERPQKDRYRQFTQISVEAFGYASPALDVELMLIGDALFSRLGVREQVSLEINSIGQLDERRAYQADLVAYLTQHKDQLDDDSIRRLETNPLRILDSKNAQVQAVLEGAPLLEDALGEESRQHFKDVCAMLDALGVAYVINPRLVRGLDYYNHSVFEWTTQALGAQGTVCAGGRYDGLVEQLGGKPTPAAGFAFGIDRILSLAEQAKPFSPPTPLVYAIALESAQQTTVLSLCQSIRQAVPSARVVFHPEVQGMKSQMKKADRSGAHFALIVGEGEAAEGNVTMKNLTDGSQHTVAQADVVAWLNTQRA
ncbi:histidine--tRNA ligase [Suttonella sp. R2A3]|uniref:histidine--tRNA ligase n=1 Tax=Suttonella sp. R2A3 TaxID=2908648 RepID=UPI001F020AF1|nr:histidine--tRNA ligase [Suttonella sp. R2A3]UJF23801.1 histidine--tRNA ligase [Suttonella sp. R2A3]